MVLEAEIDNQKGSLADASQRQQHADDGEVVADKVVAINYPAGLKAKNFSADTEIEWAVLPTEEFSSGSAWNLAGVLRRALPSGEDPDAIAKRLEAVLTSAVESLSLSQRSDLAENLGVDPSSASATIVSNAAKRALLVVASAAMFHARLDSYLPQMKPEIDARVGSKYLGEWPPQKLQHCISANDPVEALDTAWEHDPRSRLPSDLRISESHPHGTRSRSCMGGQRQTSRITGAFCGANCIERTARPDGPASSIVCWTQLDTTAATTRLPPLQCCLQGWPSDQKTYPTISVTTASSIQLAGQGLC